MEPRYHVNRLAHEIAEERIEEPRERIRLSGLRGLWATIVDGLRAIMRGMGVEKGVIAIEDNKMDAVKAMTDAASGREGVSVAVMVADRPPVDARTTNGMVRRHTTGAAAITAATTPTQAGRAPG